MAQQEELLFGSGGDAWLYDPVTKTYDLTRDAADTLLIATTQGLPNTNIQVAPSKSALVIIDMQNYFLHEACRKHPLGLAAIEPITKVVQKCREVGIEVFWLNWGLHASELPLLPPAIHRSFSRSLIDGDHTIQRIGFGADLGSNQGKCLIVGEWNTAIYKPLASAALHPEDKQFNKNRMSGMYGEQELLTYLRGDGSGNSTPGQGKGKEKRTLLFAGVNTDQCVLGTMMDAYNGGWDCVMIEDCCATSTQKAKEVCAFNVAGSYGFVTDSTAFLNAALTKG